MKANELARLPVVYVEPAYPWTEATRMAVYGLHGQDERVCALVVLGDGDDVVFEALPPDAAHGKGRETAEELRRRVVRNAPVNALRTSRAALVGYFGYDGLPLTHCRVKALHHARLYARSDASANP